MITKTVKRYFCEHCRKGGLSRAAMESHESKCFHNPNRICTVCEEYGSNNTGTQAEINAAAAQGLDAIEAIADCPACICAAVAVWNKRLGAKFRLDGELSVDWLSYDYKGSMDQLRSDHASRGAWNG